MFARMGVTANLNQGGASRSWTGTPCSPGHWVTVNKNSGRDDHCMTIDPVSQKFGSKDVTFLYIKITNTAGSGRYYVIDLYLNPGLMGHTDTVVGHWTQAQLEQRPDRKEFAAQLTQWAEKLQDASMKAFDFSKPQDAFKDIASWRTLFAVAPELVNGKFTLQFSSALNDMKYRPGFKALAYTNYGEGRTRWNSAWAMETQLDANARALRECEQGRQSTAPACQLYPIPALPAQ